MEPYLRLYDSYYWIEELFDLPIDQAGMLLFARLGYVEDEASPVQERCSSRRFVYSLPVRRYVGNDDEMLMHSISSACRLFTMNANDYPSGDKSIDVFAIDLSCAGYERSERAHGIHCLISKYTKTESIAFFRFADAFMLSFLYRSELGNVSVYLSDWFSSYSRDNGQLERMHVSTMLLSSAWDCFDCSAYEAMREYYKYPLNRTSVRYYLLDAPNARSNDWPIYYSSAEIEEAVDDYMQRYLVEYGDDYIVEVEREIELEDELILEDLEWELQQTENTDGPEFDDQQDDDDWDDEPVSSLEYGAIPDEVMADPIALLEWIDGKHKALIQQTPKDSSSRKETRSNSHIHQRDMEHTASVEDLLGTNSNTQTSTSDAARSKRDVYHHVLKQPDGGVVIPWQATYALEPPKYGMKIWHEDLGVGTVVRSSRTQLRVRFPGDVVRILVFPSAFERGIVSLLSETD